MDAPSPRYAVSISYDFVGNNMAHPDRFRTKFEIGRPVPYSRLHAYIWSSAHKIVRLSEQLQVESIPAVLGHFRPLYDALSIVVIPSIVWWRGERADVVQVQDFPLLWAAYLTALITGADVVLRLTNMPSDLGATRSTWHRWYHRLNEILASGLVDRYVVINETTRRYVLDLGVPAERITVHVPDTISPDRVFIDRVQKGRARARHRIASGTKIILTVARLENEKGLRELMQVFAAASIPDAVLIILGEGTLRKELQEKANSLGIAGCMILPGRQDRAHLWEYYADADAFVLLSRSEALGLVFWEAMYMYIPVIGRPVGGIVETIGDDGERGLYWDTKEGVDAFRDKLEQCLNKNDTVTQMIARAHEYVDAKIKSA